MEKFILTLTKRDEKTVLSVHDSKAEAIVEGENIIKRLAYDAGFLAVIYGEIDGNNNVISGKYKLCYGWIWENIPILRSSLEKWIEFVVIYANISILENIFKFSNSKQITIKIL